VVAPNLRGPVSDLPQGRLSDRRRAILDFEEEAHGFAFFHFESSVSSPSFKIFEKYCTSSGLKNARFPMPGISIGSSGTRPAAAAISAASEPSCI
jgi:hypothetical protein